MKLKASQLIVAFLVGLVTSTISGGSAFVLVLLMALLAAGSIAWMVLELNWTETKLVALWKPSKHSETPQAPREAFVIGVGHHGC